MDLLHPPPDPHIREGRIITKIEEKVGGFLPHIGLGMATGESDSVLAGCGFGNLMYPLHKLLIKPSISFILHMLGMFLIYLNFCVFILGF